MEQMDQFSKKSIKKVPGIEGGKSQIPAISKSSSNPWGLRVCHPMFGKCFQDPSPVPVPLSQPKISPSVSHFIILLSYKILRKMFAKVIALHGSLSGTLLISQTKARGWITDANIFNFGGSWLFSSASPLIHHHHIQTWLWLMWWSYSLLMSSFLLYSLLLSFVVVVFFCTTDWLTDRPTDRLTHKPTNRPTHRSTNRPTDHTV